MYLVKLEGCGGPQKGLSIAMSAAAKRKMRENVIYTGIPKRP